MFFYFWLDFRDWLNLKKFQFTILIFMALENFFVSVWILLEIFVTFLTSVSQIA